MDGAVGHFTLQPMATQTIDSLGKGVGGIQKACEIHSSSMLAANHLLATAKLPSCVCRNTSQPAPASETRNYNPTTQSPIRFWMLKVLLVYITVVY